MNLRSGYPFWLVKNGLPFNYPKLEHSIKTDVVIMGGGISGALTAYYLVNAGFDCVLVDARTIGLGSTCASTALLQYEIDVPLCDLVSKVGEQHAVRSYQLCVEAVKKLGDIASGLGFGEFEYRKSLYYAACKKDDPLLKREYRIRHESGIRVSYLEADEVQQQFGFRAPSAILSEDGAQVNAYAMTHALLQHALKKGLQVYDRTMVCKIDHKPRHVSMETQDGFRIEAKKLVYATGYEVVKHIDKKIVDLNSTYATISEQNNPGTCHWGEDAMIWNTANPYLYMRTTSDHRILVGGRDEKFFNPVKRDKLIHSKALQLARDFNHIFPDVEFRTEFSWTGVFGSTSDGLPFIGPYKKLPNSYFALGFGGNGIVFSLVAAEILTDLMTGKKNRDKDVFSFDRH
jgi:glycine/D-amino acid oxidase-like deaminating enzyme